VGFSYVKGARKGEDVLVNASVRRIGKAIVFSEAKITDKKTGDLLVEGLHTQYLLRDKCC
jgi:acyl-coenzyme A thioesterase PaaI-like protein